VYVWIDVCNKINFKLLISKVYFTLKHILLFYSEIKIETKKSFDLTIN